MTDLMASVDEHQGHGMMSGEGTESEQNIQQRIKDREKILRVLQQGVEATDCSADKTVEDIEKIFTELIHLLEKRCSDMKRQVRSQQQNELSQVKELQEKLEQEIAELKRFSHTECHSQFLHNYPLLSPHVEPTQSSSINIRPVKYFEDVTAAVKEFRDELQNILTKKWTNISWTETEVGVLTPYSKAELQTRADFLDYSCQITLDPNTVNTQLLLSEGNRRATFMREEQSYSCHPDRFIRWRQVLSRESLTGRCYWEVEWKKKRVTVAVAYKNIGRAGSIHECAFGYNDMSWAIECNSSNSYKFIHDGIKTFITGPQSSRLGVYLDHSEGILSFFIISETMTLLHKVQTAFTQPLYAGLWFGGYNGSMAEFCELK